MSAQSNGLTRRSFIATGTAAAGVTALGAGAALASEAADPTKPWIPTWDEECDIVVAGYGGAGVTAAITACEEGCSCIVLEKSPIEDGGNFGCSTANLHDTFRCDIDELKTKAKRLSFYCLPDPTVIDDLVDVMCNDMYPWLTEDLGFEFFEGTREGTDRHGTESAIMFYRNPEGRPGAGNEFFAALNAIAKEKGADVRTGSPITGLVQDPMTKEVLGVEYTTADGATHTIKANQGVIMCTGGFENSKIKQWSTPPPTARPTPSRPTRASSCAPAALRTARSSSPGTTTPASSSSAGAPPTTPATASTSARPPARPCGTSKAASGAPAPTASPLRRSAAPSRCPRRATTPTPSTTSGSTSTASAS